MRLLVAPTKSCPSMFIFRAVLHGRKLCFTEFCWLSAASKRNSTASRLRREQRRISSALDEEGGDHLLARNVLPLTRFREPSYSHWDKGCYSCYVTGQM